jgi:hypothetical protein
LARDAVAAVNDELGAAMVAAIERGALVGGKVVKLRDAGRRRDAAAGRATLGDDRSARRLRAPSTHSSSSARLIAVRLLQLPLLRAVEHPRWVGEIIEKPPPRAPQRVSPESR